MPRHSRVHIGIRTALRGDLALELLHSRVCMSWARYMNSCVITELWPVIVDSKTYLRIKLPVQLRISKSKSVH